MASRVLLLAGIPLLIGAIGGCSTHLNTQDIEATIKADIERQGRRLSLREVRCPTDVTPRSGAYFRCVGELDPEGTFTINVTQLDDAGQVEWEVPNSTVVLNLVRVEAEIEQGLLDALRQRALVNCGSEVYRTNQSGDQFECQIVGGITDGAATINRVLVTIDPDGNLNWQELRTAAVPVAGALANPTSDVPIPSASSSADPPAADNAANPDETAEAEAPPVKTTTTTGPTGRTITRPHVPGDSD